MACRPRVAANTPRLWNLDLIPDDPPARHGQHNPRVREAVRRYGREVAVEHHEVGAIPALQHPPGGLGKYPVGVAHGVGAERIIQGDLLLRLLSTGILAVQGLPCEVYQVSYKVLYTCPLTF